MPVTPIGDTCATSHTTSFPSTPDVLTRATFPGVPSYARTLVIVFWCTVNSSDSAEGPGAPGTFEIPRESALRNVLNAALLSRPTGDAPPRPARAAPPPVLFAFGSSSVPVSSHPLLLPEKTSGWQSWPAAMREFSEVHANVRRGKLESLIVYTVWPP